MALAGSARQAAGGVVLPACGRTTRPAPAAWDPTPGGPLAGAGGRRRDPDYGGPAETFTVEEIEAPTLIVYSSIRGNAGVSWVLHLEERGGSTRMHLRLRIGPVKHPRLVGTAGDWFDLLTIAGLAAGLRERLTDVTRGGLAR